MECGEGFVEDECDVVEQEIDESDEEIDVDSGSRLVEKELKMRERCVEQSGE